jgi:uncharacterized protein (TIGR00251 family)
MTIKINLKIIPNAKQNKIVGYLDEFLKIKVIAQPEKGKANKAVLALLVEKLSIKKSNIQLVSRQTSTHKVIEIQNLSLTEFKQKLDLCLNKY